MPWRQIRCGGRPVMSSPRKRTLPSSGARNPVSAANSVVLPAPFGPISPAIVPSATSRPAPPPARRPPKIFDSPRTSSTRLAPPAQLEQVDEPVGQKADDQDEKAAVDDQRKTRRIGDGARVFANQRQQ